jgi:hypothetical protein
MAVWVIFHFTGGSEFFGLRSIKDFFGMIALFVFWPVIFAVFFGIFSKIGLSLFLRLRRTMEVTIEIVTDL